MRHRVKTNDKFGRWVVLEYRPSASLCRCLCGLEKLIQNGTLSKGGSTMCGPCSNVNRKGVPGVSDHTYRRLTNMVHNAIRRCTNPESAKWSYYGGRGITVCGEWLTDKKEFIRHLTTLQGHDDERLSIDRIDNDGDYEPGNVQFVTKSESCRNRRSFSHLLSRSTDGKFIKKSER